MVQEIEDDFWGYQRVSDGHQIELFLGRIVLSEINFVFLSLNNERCPLKEPGVKFPSPHCYPLLYC